MTPVYSGFRRHFFHRLSVPWSILQFSHLKEGQDGPAEKHQLLLQRASENWFSVPRGQLTAICNCSTKGHATLCWPPRSPTCTSIHINTQTQEIPNKNKILKEILGKLQNTCSLKCLQKKGTQAASVSSLGFKDTAVPVAPRPHGCPELNREEK